MAARALPAAEGHRDAGDRRTPTWPGACTRSEELLDTDGPEPDPTEQRTLTFTRHPDGSITGRFHLDPAGAEK